jgi:hypothetical protein
LARKGTGGSFNQASEELHPDVNTISTPQLSEVHSQNPDYISTLTDSISRDREFYQAGLLPNALARVYVYDTALLESTEQQITYANNLEIDLNVVLPEASNQSFYGMEKGNRTFDECLMEQIEYANSIGLGPL